MRLLLLFLAFALAGHGAELAVFIASPPAWVDLSIDPVLAPTPATDTSYGYDYLLLERQVNVLQEARYYRNVFRLTSESSLQDGGRLTWSFDPGYEKLTVHHVRVIRDGVTQERLTENLIKTIQQERDLDRHMLNGQLTGLAVLEDVRVGDVVDYAFTRVGWNPAFHGNYFDLASAGWSVPVRHTRFQITAPADRPIGYKSYGDVTLAFSARRVGGERVLLWEGRNLRPIALESGTPSWFTPYPYVRLSEFDQWSDVVKWAEPMYAVSPTIPPVLMEQATQLTNGLSNEADKAIAILQFVQQEVRYLGIELGAGSFHPTDPVIVLARRFGDCKDKTLLFCTLMRAAGLTAYPALLDTDWRQTLDDWLPSPYAFDHVIACIPQQGGYAWVDPTLTYQQGDLLRRGLPDYRRALIIKTGESALTRITVPPAAESTVRIIERFDIPSFEQPARFQITTTFSGRGADSQRRYFAQTTPDQIAKYYVNYYASTYPGITSTTPPVLTSDARSNVVTVVESYEVPHLWAEQTDPNDIKAEFYPKPILGYADRPETTVRTMPLGIDSAVVQLTTTVNLPEEWSVTAEEKVTKNDVFRATRGIEGKGKVVTMSYTWTTLVGEVPVAYVPKYIEELNRYRNSLGYTLTYKKTAVVSAAAAPVPTPGFLLNWKLMLLACTTLAAVGYGGTCAWRREYLTPPMISPKPELAGLTGWLLLVGFGVTLRPFLLVFQIVTKLGHTFDQNMWDAITTPGGVAYQRGLAPSIVAETIGNMILVAAALVLIPLFYGKKRAFPMVFILTSAFAVVFLTVDALATPLFTNASSVTAEGNQALFQAMGQALVWIPYMCVSKRVKATFVQ